MLSATSAKGAQGDQVTIQLSIDDATGVAGADITLNYDSRFLTFVQVSTTALTRGLSLVPNASVQGMLVLGLAGAEGIDGGSGGLVDISFRIGDTAQVGSLARLTFSQVTLSTELGQAIPVSTQDGTIEVGLPCVKGDVNGDGNCNSMDAILTLRIAVGLHVPTESEQCAADMNDDGKINSADAISILRKAVGLPLAAPGSRSVGESLRVTLKQTESIDSNATEVILSVDRPELLAGADLMLSYDAASLVLLEVNAPQRDLVAVNTGMPGEIRLSMVIGQPLPHESLVQVRFALRHQQSASVAVQQFNAHDEQGMPVASELMNRWVILSVAPETSMLGQNYPNPFNPETWIPYQLQRNGSVSIRIHDITGHLVRHLDLGYQQAGFYVSPSQAAYWNGKDSHGQPVASGIYFYSIESESFSATRRMTVVK